MYHCHARFYLVGPRPELFDTVRTAPPLAAFTHSFSQSAGAEEPLAAAADVIFADLTGTEGVETARKLLSWKKPDGELILLAGEQETEALAEELAESLPVGVDLWPLPMSQGQWRFRFLRWQRAYKARMDGWQTSQFLEAAINSSPDLVWYKTKDGIHEKVNDSFCRTVGKTKTQVEGRGHAYIWDVEQDDPACIESERQVMEKRATCVSEEIIQTGGEKKTLTTYKSPLYDLDGSVMGTVGVAIDVTKEHLYAQELFRKNQALETIFTSMDCGIICHTLEGSHILRINNAALRILGYESQEEMVRDGFFLVAQTVLVEDRPKIAEALRKLKTTEDTATVEYRVRHADGKLLHVLGGFKLVEEQGNKYFQRFLLDITDRKLREEQARQEDERRHMDMIHALSQDYSQVFYFDLDTGKGQVLRLGSCEKNLLDDIFPPDLTLEKSLNDYIDMGVYADDVEPMRQACTLKNFREIFSQKPMYSQNYRTTCCGEMRYFQMRVARTGEWEDSHGIVLGFRCVDEETLKEMEKKTLLEDALSQANRASKAKSIFLSNMSHDIRTPMNAIIGFTALAISHIDRKELVEEYLKKIMTSGNHLLSLINDVLDMSRIESGKISLDEQPCSLPEILHGLRNIIQADVHAKQLDLFMDAVDVQDEEICCDRLRLNQVLLNLLSNAVKYTPAGGMVTMKIIERPGAPAGYGNYEFQVKDNGIGMEENFVAHIFEPFERERNSTISGIQGTGLGMAITKNIVELMNGSIEVKSKQGVGTDCVVSFTFRLNAGEKEPQTIPELQNLRALVVDDDFNSCDSVSCMLQQIGLRAEWTLSGKEAVLRTRQAIMRGDSYFVYIIDWLLPDMNGVEVARRIRQETGKDVPIIVLTAYDWSDIEDEAREAGVTAFCSKPIFLSELRECLQSIVHTDRQTKAEAEIKRSHREGRILLAEDNELNREIATAILEEAGFTTEVAENGKIAVDMLRASQPGYYQLILMDVQMPVMDGYGATKVIRGLEDKALASIPILAMTANAFEEDKKEALRCGMNGHIAKPIDIEKFIETLDEILD